MFIPGAVYLLINNYIPMAGIIIAFKNYNVRDGIWKSPWVGFDNFEYLFKTKDAWIITRNTLGYNLAFIVLGTVFAVTVAILLYELKAQRARKAYQTIILIPFLISMVITSYLVYGFLAQDVGFVNNSILKNLGKDSISWYSEAKYWPFILIFVNLWKQFGYNCIIYYATLMGIDKGYFEAAVIDGAGRWQRIRNITLPHLKPTIIIMTLLALGKIFYSDFGLFYQVPMNSGPLVNATNTIDTYVYRGMMSTGNLGMSSAAGFYQSIVGFVLVLSVNLIVRRVDRENALF
ncbi:ABC transporter permease subunit [Murimonas intestini]|nr:ABC transporter permease subunit [Murimonas intestini]MCR1841936.1 ABC transporter permease subunit [Murimonas intestini]MCR1865006.1 ABC transporter permease subunit [Murimonas intestini]MCR1885703.1 ABC transporter permease subunit [Murimonas intestini]